VRVLSIFIATLILTCSLHAQDISLLAKELQLYPGTKATVQWKRIFTSKRHMKRYKVDTLPSQTRMQLMQYLIKHAADSDQPIVPGL
jgi:hypothetical protein